MLAIPSAISSAFGSWRVPAMPSATTADISDSIAPSIAIANALGISSRIVWKSSANAWMVTTRHDLMPGHDRQRRQRRNPVALVPATERVAELRADRRTWKCQLSGASRYSNAAPPAAAVSASSGAGIRFSTRGSTTSSPIVNAAMPTSQ